ncbi:MAG TPA: DMT family transporter [Mycobacteriales bacterium]|jgi:drug/metabolite transporter (DMT)-like permease|nr:DMT family transporter [Mycobacteriales bacterium]
MAVVLAISLVAAACYAVGIVLQYHEAHRAPDRLVFSPKLLGMLARHPLWLVGLGMMFAGQGLQSVALDGGNLAVVEPVLTLSLLFALPLSAAWRRERLQRLDWAGAALVCAGLGLLLGVGSPTPGRSNMPADDWLLVVLAAVGAALGLVAFAQRSPWPAPRAALLGAASGVLFGLQDALTPYCAHVLASDPLSLPLSWQPYLFVLAGGYGVILMQSSYKVGPLAAGLPTMTVGEPIVGMLIGIFALGEHLGTSPTALALESVGALVMVAGCCLLSRSRLVLGRYHPSRHLADQLRAIEARILPSHPDAPPVG